MLFGGGYYHIGYGNTARPGRGGFGGGAPGGCIGQSRATPKPGDIINNGADDDGSGTVSVMAIARSVCTGTEATTVGDVRVAHG